MHLLQFRGHLRQVGPERKKVERHDVQLFVVVEQVRHEESHAIQLLLMARYDP